MGKRRAHGEGTLYFDTSRLRWVGQVWLDGRRRKVTARTKIEATSKLGRLIHGDKADRHADRKMTVAALLDDWHAKALPSRRLAPSTVERHRWAVTLLTAELGRVKAADLDVHAVERALARLAEQRGLTKASLVKIRSTLRQVYAWAERRRQVAHNPASVAELPADADDGTARRALSRDDLAALMEALDGHPWGVMFHTMAAVGLRPGEAAGLCRDAVDLDAGTLSVVRAVQARRGRPYLVDGLKTVGSRRTLELPASLAWALAQHVATIDDGLLWTAADGGPVWSSTVRSELRRACELAGILPIRPNELRHTCATLLADAGVPPHVLADLLGHRSTRMVDQFYRHRPAVIRTGIIGVDL